ncbi:MAG TPA: hypothetical protein VI300_18655 [Solirubrobacter sp.]
MNLAKTARNAAVAKLAIAFARDRLAAQLPGAKPRKRRPGKKTLLIGGIAATATAALLLKRDKVTALLPGRSDEPGVGAPESSYTPPPVSNYDAPGPVANTATPVPAPPAFESPTIDEAEEEAAAAAEAANIGGPSPDYADSEGGIASEEEAPLAEAGEGESEGDEQADLELREATEASGSSEKPPSDPEWQTWSGRTDPEA